MGTTHDDKCKIFDALDGRDMLRRYSFSVSMSFFQQDWFFYYNSFKLFLAH